MTDKKDKWLTLEEFVESNALPMTLQQFRTLLLKRNENGLINYVRRVHNRLWTTIPLMLAWWDTQKDVVKPGRTMTKTWDRKGGRPKKAIPEGLEPVKIDPALAPQKQLRSDFDEVHYDASQIKGKQKIRITDAETLKKVLERFNIELI